jgi:hypothetical protein
MQDLLQLRWRTCAKGLVLISGNLPIILSLVVQAPASRYGVGDFFMGLIAFRG